MFKKTEKTVLWLNPGSPNFLFLSESYKSYYTTIRGPDIIRNVTVSGCVTFYQISKCFVNVQYYFSLLTKFPRGPDGMASRAGFGPRAVVLRPCYKLKMQLVFAEKHKGNTRNIYSGETRNFMRKTDEVFQQTLIVDRETPQFSFIRLSGHYMSSLIAIRGHRGEPDNRLSNEINDLNKKIE